MTATTENLDIETGAKYMQTLLLGQAQGKTGFIRLELVVYLADFTKSYYQTQDSNYNIAHYTTLAEATAAFREM